MVPAGDGRREGRLALPLGISAVGTTSALRAAPVQAPPSCRACFPRGRPGRTRCLTLPAFCCALNAKTVWTTFCNDSFCRARTRGLVGRLALRAEDTGLSSVFLAGVFAPVRSEGCPPERCEPSGGPSDNERAPTAGVEKKDLNVYWPPVAARTMKRGAAGAFCGPGALRQRGRPCDDPPKVHRQWQRYALVYPCQKEGR